MKMPPPLASQFRSVRLGRLWTTHMTKTMTSASMNAQLTLLWIHFEASASVDFLLLDSGNPNLKVRELGGTGRIHNWKISKRIVELSKVPVFLAGGLRPDNVAKAIKSVKPYGLDLCSGVRTNGLLDPSKLEAFFKATSPQ